MLNPVVSQGAGAGDLAVCNNIPQQPYEFARIFSAFNG
jgi:hypothetical protein